MEESSEKNNLTSQDPWSSGASDGIKETKEEASQSEEENRIRAAMLEWKKKGNSQLADACAEALSSAPKQKENHSIDNENTQKIKNQINKIEAQAEAEMILKRREESNAKETKGNNDLSIETSTESFQKEQKYKSKQEHKSLVSTKDSFKEINRISTRKEQNAYTGLISKKLTNTKFVLRLIGIISLFELSRMLLVLFS